MLLAGIWHYNNYITMYVTIIVTVLHFCAMFQNSDSFENVIN